MMKNIILPLVVTSLALSCCYKASADITIYNNGPIDGSTTAWAISNGNVTSDTFTLSGNATITSIDFGSWTTPGDTIDTTDWIITSGADEGTIYAGNADVDVSSVSKGTSTGELAGYSLYENTFSTGSVVLTAGTYYLSLGDAVAENGGIENDDQIYWDQNGGPSTAVYYGKSKEFPPSESFDLNGTVPEPSGLVLTSIGMLFVGFFIVRRRRSVA
jgi:hypothetical protein